MCGWQALGNGEVKLRARASLRAEIGTRPVSTLRMPWMSTNSVLQNVSVCLKVHEFDMTSKYPTPDRPTTRMPTSLGSTR
jgi:hypothetical protein